MKKQNRKQSPKGNRPKAAPRTKPRAVPVVLNEPAAAKPPLWHHILPLAAIVLAIIGSFWLVDNLFGTPFAIGNRLVNSTASDEQIEKLIASQAAGYRLTLKYPSGQTLSFSPADIGLYPNTTASVAALRSAQRGWLHRVFWWQPVPAQLSLRTDNAALQAFIAAKATLVTSQPVDAQISLSGGKVVITPGKDGRQYGFSNAARSITDAVRSLRATPLPLTTVARQPAISTRSLASTKQQLEHILAQKIHIAIGSETVTPAPANIASWLTLTPQHGKIVVSINQDELRGYFKTVADEHTKDARSRVISDVNGAVLVDGTNGISVNGTDAVNDQLAAAILHSGGASLSLPTQTTAFKTVYAPTGDKWIEVDTTTKRMYAYDQGKLVRSFLVSAGASGTPTVIGRFAIYAKYASQDMFGTNTDGTSYFQPSVPYVNYFYRDYAIHGNYWRPASYFGSINSSHGCVGISVSESAWMYSWAPIGTPVIVHT